MAGEHARLSESTEAGGCSCPALGRAANWHGTCLEGGSPPLTWEQLVNQGSAGGHSVVGCGHLGLEMARPWLLLREATCHSLK